MKKILILAGLFFITSASITFAAGAASSVFRDTAGFIRPLILTDFIKGLYFTATSTTQASMFPLASTTQLSSSQAWIINASTTLLSVSTNTWLTNLAAAGGAVLAVDPNGKVIATTTSQGTVTSVTGTYPIISSGGTTPAISIAFGTTTANTWSALQTFNGGASTTAISWTATSTGSNGINLSGGCFAIGGTCLVSSTGFPTSTNPLMATYFVATSTTIASQFPFASTTAISWTATSTGTSGINLSGGCFAFGGTCLVSNTSGLTGGGVNGMMTAWNSATNLIATSTIVGGQFIATSTVASQFPNASTTFATISNLFTGLTAFNLLATDGNGKMVATSSISVGFLTGILPIANGGTATSTGGFTNGVFYFDGTKHTNTANLSFNGTNLSVGATTTFGTLLNLNGIANFTTATSTFYSTGGINLAAGCFAIGNTCLVSNTSGLTGSGVTGMMAAWSGTNSLIATSTIVGGQLIATSTTIASQLPLASTTHITVSTNQWLTALATAAGTFLAVDTNGKIIATTSPQPALTFPLTIAQGGTASTTGGYTNGVFYFDGTRHTNTANLSFNGTNLSVGATTTFGTLLNLNGIANFTTATSTFYGTGGFNIAAGCYAVGGTCLVTGTGSLGAGTTGQVAYYNGTNTAVGTSTLFFATTGRAGIGTTTAPRALTVVAPVAQVAASFASMSGVTSKIRVYNAADLETTGGEISVAPTTGDTTLGSLTGFLAFSAATERMRIVNATGNVGIGTTSPGVVPANGFASTGTTLQVSSAVNSANLYLRRNDGLTGFDVTADGFIDGQVYLDSRYDSATAGTAGFQFRTRTAGTAINALRIDGAGNVGIGTTSPSTGLHVANGSFSVTSNAGNGGVFIDGTQGYGRLYGVNSSETAEVNLVLQPFGHNVGIGTTTPGSILTVLGHIGTDGARPALSACGTSPAITTGSTDTAFEITQGSISTGCVITFATAYARAPFCTVTDQAGLAFSYTTSASAITVVNIGALSSTKMNGICVSNDL